VKRSVTTPQRPRRVGSPNDCTKPRASFPKRSTGLPPLGPKCTCSSWKLTPAGARCSGARCSGTRCSGAKCSGARCSGTRCSGARCSGTRCSGERCSGARSSGARGSGARCPAQNVPDHHGNHPPPGQNVPSNPAICHDACQNILGLPANYALLGQNAPALPADNALPNPLAHAPPLNYYTQSAANAPDAPAIYQKRTPDPSTEISTPSLVRSNAPTPRVLPMGGNYLAPDPMPTGLFLS